MSSHQFLETYRAVVRDEDCDALGHMNVQHYFRAVSDGMFAVMAHLGLGESEIARRKLCFAVVRSEANFRRELRAGEAVALDSTVTEMGDKLVVFHHRLRTVPAGEVAMTVDYKCVPMDLERRRAVPVPEDIRMAVRAAFPSLAAPTAAVAACDPTTTAANPGSLNHESQSLHR